MQPILYFLLLSIQNNQFMNSFFFKMGVWNKRWFENKLIMDDLDKKKRRNIWNLSLVDRYFSWVDETNYEGWEGSFNGSKTDSKQYNNISIKLQTGSDGGRRIMLQTFWQTRYHQYSINTSRMDRSPLYHHSQLINIPSISIIVFELYNTSKSLSDSRQI